MDPSPASENHARLSQRILERWREQAYQRALQVLHRPELADVVVERCWTKLMLKLAQGPLPGSPAAILLQSVQLGSLQLRKGPLPRVRLAGDWAGEEPIGSVRATFEGPEAGRGLPFDLYRQELARFARPILAALTPRQTRVWCACRLAGTMKRAAVLAGMSVRQLRETVQGIAKKVKRILEEAGAPPTRLRA